MSRTAKLIFVALLCLQSRTVLAGMTTTITDTQPLIDWPECRCGIALPGVLDFALFDFTGQGELCGLNSVELTLTMQDGDTGAGDFDHGNLFLALDGVNTGIALDGFATDQELSLSFGLDSNNPQWMSSETIQQILDNVNADGQLFASIIDLTPDDNEVNLYSAFDTSIRLTGTICDPNPVPEPLSVATWTLVGGAALLYARRRRKNRAAH